MWWSKEMKIYQAVSKIKEIQDQTEDYPYEVWTKVFGAKFAPSIFGSQICINPHGDADYCTIKEAQIAVEYLVKELGGKVTWKL